MRAVTATYGHPYVDRSVRTSICGGFYHVLALHFTASMLVCKINWHTFMYVIDSSVGYPFTAAAPQQVKVICVNLGLFQSDTCSAG